MKEIEEGIQDFIDTKCSNNRFEQKQIEEDTYDDGGVKVLLDIKEKNARFKQSVTPLQITGTMDDQEAVELDQVNVAMNLEAHEDDGQALVEDMDSDEDSTLWILIFVPFVIILVATVMALLVPMFL